MRVCRSSKTHASHIKKNFGALRAIMTMVPFGRISNWPRVRFARRRIAFRARHRTPRATLVSFAPSNGPSLAMPPSSATGTAVKLKIVENWQDAGFTGGPALGDLDDDEMFAAEEVEAAQIMFDAFRAIKGPDGELIDTARWSASADAQVEVRRRPRSIPTLTPTRIRPAPPFQPRPRPTPTLTPDTPVSPVPVPQDIVAAARREATGVHDDIGRNALLLHAKRDLYMVAFQGVVDLLKRSEAPDTGAILEAIKDIFKDLCDDWRELVDQSRRDVADADADARETRDRRRRLEREVEEARRDAADARAALAVAEDARRRAEDERDRAERGRRTGGNSSPEEDESSHSDASRGALSPVAPSTVSPNGRVAGRLGSRPKSVGPGSGPGLGSGPGPNARAHRRGKHSSAVSSAPARDPFAENKPTPRWALDTPSAAVAAAAARGVSRGGAHQFGPDKDAASVRGRGGAAARQKHAAAAVARRWTAKQLLEVIREIADAKPACDARQAKHRRRRETMREHLYSHLNRKFGVPAVIDEWATSIVAALNAHADEDCEIASFRLVLGNLLDEEYRAEQRAISATVEELVRANVRSKHPTASEETLRAKTNAKLRGDLLEREWIDMVRFMYGRSDGAPLVARLREAQRRHLDANLARELERVTLEHAVPGTRRVTKAELEATARRRATPRVPTREFTQACLFHCLRAREAAIAPFAEAVADMGALGEGVLDEAQFGELCRRCRPDMREADVEAALLRLDPWNSGGVTASSAYAALTPGLEAEEKGEAARGLPAGEASRASLWGVGRGELTWGK